MRFLMGAGNAITGVGKAMVSEAVPEAHQARAMSSVALMFSLGLIVGPAGGGLMYDTISSWPALVPSIPPTVIAVATLVLCHFKLRETHFPQQVHAPAAHVAGCSVGATDKTGKPTSRPKSPRTAPTGDDGAGLELVSPQSESSSSVSPSGSAHGKLVATSQKARSGYMTLDDDDVDDVNDAAAAAAVEVTAPESQGWVPDAESKGCAGRLSVPDDPDAGTDTGDDASSAVDGHQPDHSALLLRSAARKPPSIWKQKLVWLSVIVYTLWSGVNIGIDEVMPLW